MLGPAAGSGTLLCERPLWVKSGSGCPYISPFWAISPVNIFFYAIFGLKTVDCEIIRCVKSVYVKKFLKFENFWEI